MFENQMSKRALGKSNEVPKYFTIFMIVMDVIMRYFTIINLVEKLREENLLSVSFLVLKSNLSNYNSQFKIQ